MDKNIFSVAYARTFQKVMYVASNFLKWRKPQVYQGKNSLESVAQTIKERNFKKPLIITDPYLDSIGIYEPLTKKLDELDIKYVIYNKVVANPTVQVVNEATETYKNNSCDLLIAIGGGSSMDCAKGVGALISCPKKTLKKMKGVLKVRKKIPFLICVPTTAGTGSETTIATVITDTENQDKYAINDLNLIPNIAVLDPLMTVNLPKNLTATTGMDTITHAVEAFIGKSNTKDTKFYARNCIKRCFESLETCYNNGQDLLARENMLKASFEGGLAFTRAYVGTVHALAHSLGGYYGIPHGLANAVLLPVVLRAYGKSVYKPLSILAEDVFIEGKNKQEKAERFIEAIEGMNERMNIPKKFGGKYKIEEKDLDALVEHSFKEIVPLYPVPKILSKKQLKDILVSIMD